MSQDCKEFATLVELLRFRASANPQGMAYTYLREGVHEDKVFTYAELDRAARAIAVALTRGGLLSGDRALLVYPPGVEFIAAFFGCLYAGVVPIPAPPPDGARMKRTFPRLRGIIEDASARLILSTDVLCQNAASVGQEETPWLASELVDLALADAWQLTPALGSDLAYLQYTSGSTSTPKGVMLTHTCVLRNLELSKTAWDYTDDSVAVTWMPYFHDYGLVDGLLQPVYSGIPCYVLSPLTFVKRPQRWLEAISRYRGTHTQAPNFAYQLCLDKITPEQRDALDLRSLRVASNGAEPLRVATFERFIAYFASCGFRPESYYPAYGLAEATLLVSTKRGGEVLDIRRADALMLEREQKFVEAEGAALARSVISCGLPLGDLQVAIVNPHTRCRVGEHEVGEIWVNDPCVAVGYWGRPEDSKSTYGVQLADAPDAGGFLRTGDLGFLRAGELYVTGRLKDLIVIDGVNHYPQDIEWTVQQCAEELRPDHCAAFSVEVDGEEKLVVVAEANRPLDDWQPLFYAVRRAVSDAHELQLHAFVVLRKGGIHKTSSGKLQRRNCRSAYLDDSLATLARWDKPRLATAAPAVDAGADRRIAEWLVAALSARLEIVPALIDPDAAFASYGLTSRIGVELVGALEQWLGKDDLSPTMLWEYPSITALCAHLASSGAVAVPELRKATVTDGPIAIIGMACRLPGANNPEEFWQLLRSKGEAISTLPQGRWQGSGMAVLEGEGPGKVRTLRGGFLPLVDQFDAELFGIGAREAQIMDPQQRMLLETAWEALEQAGLSADAVAGSDSGVFVGISTDDYSAWQFGDADNISAYTGPAKALCIAANRISYQFDFVGPSMAIDTACSSSLVAIHQASSALRRGECGMALAGGVNLLLAPQMSIALSQAGMLAPDGRCKTFDAAADGYVRGEGCVLLVLKRLEDAQRDGDTITAVIRGSAVNQDGRSNGLTAPNGLAQQRVVQQALAAAGVDGREISYVEAHGTGTALGDPIEVKALKAVLGEGREHPCALGAVKANIGHLEAAAGAAGLMKAALCLSKGEIAPHPTLRTLNPLIGLDGSGFFVPTEAAAWPEGRRLAGVSSFGFGGTNAHIILEAPPAVVPPPAAAVPERPLHVLTLNARDPQALRAAALQWQAHLAQSPAALADLGFSSNTTRARLPERLALVGADQTAMAAALADWLAQTPGAWQAGSASAQRKPRIAFLFTGQGSQSIGMGRELYRSQPGFRADMDQCDALLRELVGIGLLDLLYGEQNGEEAEALLARTDLTQPFLFALEYSLARLWISWGIEPVAMLGHSIGEYVAAAIAGVFSLADGLRLVATRARLMHQAPGDGAMLAVVADVATCRAALAGFEEQVVIAVFNGPRNHVLSGERAALDAVAARLAAQGIETRALNVSHAFHSPLMQAAAQELAAAAAGVTFHAPATPIFSNVTGKLIGAELARPEYWVAHLLSPVQFAQGLGAMHASGVDAFIEIGPRATLLALGQQSLDDADLLWLPSLRPQRSDSRLMFDSLAALHVRGAKVDWAAFDQFWPRARAALPLYPFQGRRHWLPPVSHSSASAERALPFPGKRISSPLLAQTLFENRYDTATLPLLAEHLVFGQVVVPGAAHISLLLEAAASMLGDAPCALSDVIFPQALVIPATGARRIQLAVAREASADGRAFKLISLAEGDDEAWEEHATGRLTVAEPAAGPALSALREICSRPLAGDFYQDVWQAAIELGPRFRWVNQVWLGDQQVLARLSLAEPDGTDGTRLHPGLIDSMLQILTAAVDRQADEALVPFSFESFRWLAPLRGAVSWSHIALRAEQARADEVVSDVSLFDDDGRLVAEARGFRAKRVASRSLLRSLPGGIADAVHVMQWEDITPVARTLAGTALVIGAQPAEVGQLAQSLAGRSGLTCLQAVCGSDAGLLPGQRFVPLADAAGVEQFLREQGGLSSVICLTEELQPDAVLASAGVLHLVQAMTRLAAPAPRLVLVTRAARAALPTDSPRADQAAVCGLANVVRLEHPELDCQLIDLGSADAVANAVPGLLQDASDVALRDGRVLMPLLVPYKPAAQENLRLRDDATYLVSGGLGALGLQVAEWLVEHGARHLLLLGRRAPSEAAAARLALLTQAGVNVQTRALDISDANALESVLQQIQPAVAGVFHLAGVLDDGMLLQQDGARLSAVFAPKLGGALNLHQWFAKQSLDHFVSFSSVAGLTGSMGQGAYAAANAALDSLMALRRAQGLPGLSIQWGPWAEAGMAAQQTVRDRQRFADYGITPIAPADGMALLGQLMQEAQATLAVLPVVWPTYLEQLYGAKFPAMYRQVAEVAAPRKRSEAAPVASGLAARLKDLAPSERRAVLETQLNALVAGVLGLTDKQAIGPRERLFEIGLDSLGAVELRNRLVAALGLNLRATLLFDYPTMLALADHIEQDVLGFTPASAQDEIPVAEIDNHDQLSDDELARLLAAELG